MEKKRTRRRYNLSEEEQRIYDKFLLGKLPTQNEFNILLRAVSEHRVNMNKMNRVLNKLDREYRKVHGKHSLD